jgi:uncharacterized membrane protein YheB (UPF0754 family)
MLDEARLKNEWIHVDVRIVSNLYSNWNNEDVVESGIHVLKHFTSMDDFQFNVCSLFRKRKSDEDLSVSETELVEQQQRMALLSLQ